VPPTKAGLIARSQDAGSVNFELTNFAAASNELLEISTAFGFPVEPLVQIIRPESILQGIETSIADSYLFAKDSPLVEGISALTHFSLILFEIASETASAAFRPGGSKTRFAKIGVISTPA
jgi:hypothetical protein